MSGEEIVFGVVSLFVVAAFFAGMFWSKRQMLWQVQSHAEDKRPYYVPEGSVVIITNEGHYRIELITPEEARKMDDAFRRLPIS